MLNRRTEKNYTVEKVGGFLISVKQAIGMGENCHVSYRQILRFYRFGRIATKALERCGFVKIDGRGFCSWTWIPNRPTNDEDTITFILAIDALKKEHNEKYRGKACEAETPENVVRFQPTQAQKAVQVELPIHPVRLTVLNGIRTELNEIRLQLEKIEDRIDNESVKKSAER